MQARRFLLPLPLVLAAALGLAGCDTAEERAQAHHERAKALIAEGQVEQAIVELRNVFRLDETNAAARLDYANLLLARGDTEGAIGQFLRLAEQDWGNVAAHRRLAELALEVQDFDTAETHANRAHALDPADPAIRAMKAAVDYNKGEQAAAVAMARGVLAETPDNLTAHMVLIAERMDAGDLAGALALTEAALARAPGDRGLHLVKLAVLERQGDRAAAGAELARMAELFPEDAGIAGARIAWHLEAGDIAAAEPLLRARAAAEPAGSPERVAAELALAQALYDTRGPQAARAELDRLAAAAPGTLAYARARAELEVHEGRVEAGIAAYRAIIAASEPSGERRDAQAALARVLAETGAETGAAAESEALLEAVLAEDPGHVAALKLRARRLIDADRPEAAIADLRAAIDQEPRDAETLTLMAEAHEREGARALAGERLALAVEVSDGAPETATRYARFLIEDGKVEPAEAVVAAALGRHPADPGLLALLGRIRASRGDWHGADQAVAGLRGLGTPDAADLATALEAEILGRQDRFAEAIDRLKTLADGGGGDAALAGIAETYVRAGDLAGARTFLEGERAKAPEAPLPRLLMAGVDALDGREAAAEAAYRALIADDPGYAPAYESLVLLLAASGRGDEAAALIAEGRAATGDDPRLRFLEAGRLEAEGDVEGAIALYEGLYAEDSGSAVVANNLASLLSSHRDDAASRERAFVIARRLADSEVPHFQDTYGWILLLRGDAAAALPHLERAARALPQEPLVLYHLAAARNALGQPEAARQGLERALALAGPDRGSPAMAEAAALLDSLSRNGH
jgi:predicted Zn-dependent protease